MIVFCLNCMEEVDYISETKQKTLKVKGVDITIDDYVDTFCAKCGGPVYVEDIDEENFKKFYSKYDEKIRGII